MRKTLPELVREMNARTGSPLIELGALEREIGARDREIANPYTKDAQITALFSMRQEFENCFVAVVRAGIESGEFRSGDLNVLTKAVLGAVNWMNVWYHPGPSDVAARLSSAARALTRDLGGAILVPTDG